MSLYLAGPTQQQMHDLHLVHKALFNHSKPVTRTAQALATGLEVCVHTQGTGQRRGRVERGRREVGEREKHRNH